MIRYIPLIMAGVMLNAVAQLSIKQGMRQIGHFDFHWENVLPIGFGVACNPFVLIGLFCYVVSVVVWMMVLSRVEVSFAYPLLSVGYIVTAFAGHYFFQESIGTMRWAGIIVICLGVWLITRTG